MTNLEKRFIIKSYNELTRKAKELQLVYRGTAYKKTVL